MIIRHRFKPSKILHAKKCWREIVFPSVNENKYLNAMLQVGRNEK
ncbi:DUF2737 family protein [Salmonella enterica subsp. enterica]|nr:DUF2737 family protein [Salmonella enterica subsp. enterica]